MSAPVLTTAEPRVVVTGFERGLPVYVDLLSFRAVSAHGEPPFSGKVVRDADVPNLRFAHQPALHRSTERDLLSAARRGLSAA